MRCHCSHEEDHHNPRVPWRGMEDDFAGSCRNCECQEYIRLGSPIQRKSLNLEDQTEDVYLRRATDVARIVKEKNEAYGSAFAKAGEFLKLLYPDGINPGQYKDALLLVRIFDKQMRVANKKNAFGENPYEDIQGYGLLGSLDDDKKIG